ncbi:MAG: glycoside hydrolase family 99-like domain-containing protein [Armatimonadota bacterium]
MKRSRSVLAMAACVALAASQAVDGKAKPLIGVYYFPGWHIKPPIKPLCPGGPPENVGEWRYAIMRAAKPRPLCGFYDDSDPRLWTYYIDWMTSHGIDFIAFDWYYNDKQQFLYEALDRGLLESAERDRIKFCLHWCNHGGNWWHKPLNQSKAALVEMMDEVCHRYFHHSNYLKIYDRPVFIIYDIETLLGFGGPNGVRESLKAMRAVAKKHGFGGLYLVACYSSNSSAYVRMLKDLGFDAFCAYTYSWMRPPNIAWNSKSCPYRDVVDLACNDLYPFLQRIGGRCGIPYWPTTFPSWDDRPRAGLERAFVLTDNAPEEFGRMFRSALAHVNPSSPVVMVEAWNEWGEGAHIEPSKEHAFGYLKEIASALGLSPAKPSTPSADEILSWSILSQDEIKTAQDNESKPWPFKPPVRVKIAASYDAPDAQMPVVLDLTESGLSAEKLILSGVDVKNRTREGSIFLTTDHDPQIIFPPIRVPARQVGRITIEAKILEKSSANAPEPVLDLYWQTGLIPEFTPYCSVKLPPSPEGKITMPTDEIMAWLSGGTPITRLRLDLGEAPGYTFVVKMVILSPN